MRQELYYKDAYLKEFDTVVKECDETNGKIRVVLEETAFYPEGGGQNADTGFINDIKVLDVREDGDKIYHIVEKRIEVGEKVHCKLNFEQRFLNMQMHTGEHIVSGLVHDLHKGRNVGFHMGEKSVTIDFDVVLTKKDILEIEKKANEAIYENLDVQVKIYNQEEIKKIEYRSKKELTGDVRIVTVPGYDECACCGVHVSKTGEIGAIKITSLEKYKSGTRINLLIGYEVIKDYEQKYNCVNDISTLFSVKHEDVYNTVEKMKEELNKVKKELTEVQETIIESKIKSKEQEERVIIIEENLSIAAARNILMKIKLEKTIAMFSKENDSFKYIIHSKKENTKEIAQKINAMYNGRGGGNINLAQGQLFTDSIDINQMFE